MPRQQKKDAETKKPAAVKGSLTKPAQGKIQKPKKVRSKKGDNPLFQSTAKNFGIGNDLQPKRDLTRFVKWPHYIKLQRQKRILLKRIKVPGVIDQFSKTLDKHNAQQLFLFLQKYSPEDKKQKKKRLLALAKKGEGEGPEAFKKPKAIKSGLRNVTNLIESKRAKLVIIAHDVDPIELVLWLPSLCRKKGVPYIIVKGKSRLGALVHQKTASCLAITDVEPKDQKDLANFVEKGVENFNNRLTDNLRSTGGGVMGSKHVAKKRKEERRKSQEKKALNK